MIDKVRFGATDLAVSPVVMGTWVTGGWAWGGSDEKESILAVLRALEQGINFIDTAPVYGFGRSECLIGEALKQWGTGGNVVVATKCGLEWDEKERIRRNSSRARIRQEADDSLKRLGVERIDLYQIHWPDYSTPFEESMEEMLRLKEEGKIRYVGLSNFSRQEVEACMEAGSVFSLQPPYNVFEREAEQELLPFCRDNQIATLVYGGLCRGLLSGKFTGDEQFAKGDLRRGDPKFKPDRFKLYVRAVNEIKTIAASYGRTTAQFALRWALQQPGVTSVIAGARTAIQAEDNAGACGWEISPEDLKKVDAIVSRHIKEPIGPGFMAPKKEG